MWFGLKKNLSRIAFRLVKKSLLTETDLSTFWRGESWTDT